MTAALWVDVDACTVPAVPVSPGDYQTAFRLRGVWGGGDSARTIPLADGRVLWVFGDTWVDQRMARNSMVVQEGARFHAVWGGGAGTARTTALPASKPGCWTWPTGGVERYGLVRLVMQRMNASPAPFRVEGVDVVTVDLNTMAVLSCQPAMVDQTIRWSGFVVDGGDSDAVYVCGTRGYGAQVLAATRFETMASEPWRLWNGDGWSTDGATSRPLKVEGSGTFSHFFASPRPEGGWVMSGKLLDGYTTDLTLWTADHLTGPYTRRGIAATIGDKAWKTYSARVEYLPGVPGLTAIWSQSPTAPSWPPAAQDKALYGPCFGTPDLTCLTPP